MERELETTKENNKEFHKELTNIKSQLHGKKEKMDTSNCKRQGYHNEKDSKSGIKKRKP